ncbi:MAG: hypothetical protein ABW208_29155 [Pyrinomonadaceae bacterium]
MDNEQFERQKEFILNQQAQFAAKIGQLEDGLTRLVGVVERVVDTVGRLAQATAERFEDTDRKLAALVNSQMLTEEVVRKLGERMDSLAATVERHIAEGHNGRARLEG